ncbi:MAG: hypothetical protein KDC92_02555 [Bacteroidetes bacterium]|nr:hypothetical protein [Bacteroidota bacterium]
MFQCYCENNLASHGVNATNVSVLGNLDQNLIKNNVLINYAYCDLLADLLNNTAADVVEQSMLNYSTTADAALAAITNYTVFDYLKAIKAEFGQTVYDAILTAIGGVQATYVAKINLVERHIYGSKRLGIHQDQVQLYQEEFVGVLTTGVYSYTNSTSNNVDDGHIAIDNHLPLHRGKRRYELANHCGQYLGS